MPKALLIILPFIMLGCVSYEPYIYDGDRNLSGQFEGHGRLALPTGEKYTGEWLQGKRHGQGTNVWPTGEKYIGGWARGKRTGHGTNIRPDGEKYVGEWKDDKKLRGSVR